MSERHDNDCGCEWCRLRPEPEPADEESDDLLVRLRRTYKTKNDIIEKLEAANAKLREALKRYGVHPRICDGYNDGNDCTCGLDAALKDPSEENAPHNQAAEPEHGK